jgi:ElaB/YqjD/DUF883 family membrane-anchored ribosome-binding protein
MRINKKHIPYLVGLGILLFIALGFQTCRLVKAERKAESLEGVISGQAFTLVQAHKATDAALQAKKEADDKAAKVKADADKQIAEIQKNASVDHAAYEALQAQIVTLTDDALAGRIGERIGEREIRAVVAGGFSLTRPGGEGTIRIFDSEALAQRDLIRCGEEKWQIQLKLTEAEDQGRKDNAAIDALKSENAGYVDHTALLNERVKALKLSGTLKFWKGMGIGAGLGVLIAVLAGK